jgi:hypothetical protein
MPTYVDLLKLLEATTERHEKLVLPHPLEEIFPDLVPSERHEPPIPWVELQHKTEIEDLLKKKYEDLVTSTFEGRA